MKIGCVRLTGSFLLTVAWLLYLDTQNVVALCLLACFFHEMGHIAAIYLSGNTVCGIDLTAVGAQMKTGTSMSFVREGIVALAGPGVNIILALVFSFLPWGRAFSGINLVLGCLNLIPVFPLDGGRMMYALMTYLTSAPLAQRITNAVGFLSALALGITGVYIAIQFGNISLLLFSGWLLATHFNRKVCD